MHNPLTPQQQQQALQHGLHPPEPIVHQPTPALVPNFDGIHGMKRFLPSLDFKIEIEED